MEPFSVYQTTDFAEIPDADPEGGGSWGSGSPLPFFFILFVFFCSFFFLFILGGGGHLQTSIRGEKMVNVLHLGC